METTQSIEIVSFDASMQSGVCDLILPIQQDEFDIPVSLEDQPDLTDIEGYYRQGAGEFWVATSRNEVVGTIALLDIGNQMAALRKMFVQQAFRGRTYQIAPLLLAQLVRHAETNGIRKVLLGTTEAFLAAHRFYERSGFALISEDELPDTFPRMKVDTRFYALALTG